MQAKQIKCPQCGRFTFYSLENPSRPFCSARCKLIDLGQWADENYKVPSETHVDFNSPLDEQDIDESRKTTSFGENDENS
jgi:endogenous inhibitor of DNA gyrase (YacG/DUF329 family)